MALKIKQENLDSIDTAFHSLYTQQTDGSYLLTGVGGMKTQADIDNVTRVLTKERADHKVTKDKYVLLGDQDPADILVKLDRIAELEAAAGGKIDETKINELVEARIKTKLGPVERDLNLTKQKLTEAETRATELSTREKRRTVHDSVRSEAIKSKMLPEAYDDALMYADSMLEIAEDGRIVTRDQVGVTPGIGADVWLIEMQAKKRHWWPGSQSGNSSGSGGNLAGGDNPWSAAGWNLTKQGEILDQDTKRADQLARSAGTTVGGRRPEHKAA